MITESCQQVGHIHLYSTTHKTTSNILSNAFPRLFFTSNMYPLQHQLTKSPPTKLINKFPRLYITKIQFKQRFSKNKIKNPVSYFCNSIPCLLLDWNWNPTMALDFWSSFRQGFGLGPIQKLLLLGCLVINGEHYLAGFTNLEGVTDNRFISWADLPGFWYNNSVTILCIRHELGSIAYIPTQNSEFPDQKAPLQIQ